MQSNWGRQQTGRRFFFGYEFENNKVNLLLLNIDYGYLMYMGLANSPVVPIQKKKGN